MEASVRRKTLLFLISTPVLLAGCAQPLPPMAPPAPTPFQQAVHRSMNEIARQLALLNLSEGHYTPAPPTPSAAPRPVLTGPLGQRVSFHWNGPLDPALRKIAKKMGWTYTLTGITPTTPVMVAATAKNRTWYSILHNIANQTGPDCTVAVNGQTHNLSVIYTQVSTGVHDGGPAFAADQTSKRLSKIGARLHDGAH
jgi:defect-in-organelle-trafficking protein DotD